MLPPLLTTKCLISQMFMYHLLPIIYTYLWPGNEGQIKQRCFFSDRKPDDRIKVPLAPLTSVAKEKVHRPIWQRPNDEKNMGWPWATGARKVWSPLYDPIISTVMGDHRVLSINVVQKLTIIISDTLFLYKKIITKFYHLKDPSVFCLIDFFFRFHFIYCICFLK